MQDEQSERPKPPTFGYAVLAEITGLPRRVLVRLVREDKIPHLRVSERCALFERKQIEAWLAKHRRGPWQ